MGHCQPTKVRARTTSLLFVKPDYTTALTLDAFLSGLITTHLYQADEVEDNPPSKLNEVKDDPPLQANRLTRT
jgi:hypothetical protein